MNEWIKLLEKLGWCFQDDVRRALNGEDNYCIFVNSLTEGQSNDLQNALGQLRVREIRRRIGHGAYEPPTDDELIEGDFEGYKLRTGYREDFVNELFRILPIPRRRGGK